MSDDMIQKLYTENMDLIQNVYLNNDSRKLFQDTIKLNQNSKYKMSCFESQMLLKFLPMLLVALAPVITSTVTADVVVAILVALSAVISLKISYTMKISSAKTFSSLLTNLLVAGGDKSMIQPPVSDKDIAGLVAASGLINKAPQADLPVTIDWTKLMTATKNLLVPPPGSGIQKTYNLSIMKEIIPMLSYEISLITPLNDPFCASVKNSTASISHKNNTNSLISSLINLYSTTLLARLGPPPRPMPPGPGY